MKRLVGFGDADAFYASAEVVRRPHLEGVPVGILGNQGACVIARSYEMKRFGVKVGEPVWEAREKCPDGVYVKRDFRWYEALSRKMLAEIGTFSRRVEYYSIDEFFWQGEAGLSDQAAATRIRDHIKRTVGTPMTVALARTRMLAKLFAETHKPFGAITVVDREHERELLATIPVVEIPGIGRRRAARLEPFGIRNCLDFVDASGIRIRQLLTIVGQDLWLELNGVPVLSIRPERSAHKNVARGGSLAGRVSDPVKLYGWLVRNVERLIEELQYHGVRPRMLSVFLAYRNADSAGSDVRLCVPSDRFDVLLDAAKLALRRSWRPGADATHMHVVASQLVRPPAWQRSLFEPDDPRLDAIARVKSEVNARFGRWKLRSGATLFANEFYQDSANEYDICDVRGKFCF